MFELLGKPYTVRYAIEACMMATHTVGKTYYDKHAEAHMHDYAEEIVEPQPPKENMIGIQVHQKPQFQLDMTYVDIDTEALLARTSKQLR